MAITDGLLASYSMDGDVTDDTGSFDATNNGTTSVTGKVNQGRGFNGTTDNISTPFTQFDILGDLSISFWFKSSNSINEFMYSSRFRVITGDAFGYGVRIAFDGGINFFIGDGSGTDFATTNTKGFNDGAWHLVVCTRNGSTVHVYVDNVDEALTISGTIPSGNIVFSGSFRGFGTDDAGTIHYGGDLDIGLLHTRELSSAEAGTLWNGGTGLQFPFTSVGWSGNINNIFSIFNVNGIPIGNINDINNIQ